MLIIIEPYTTNKPKATNRSPYFLSKVPAAELICRANVNKSQLFLVIVLAICCSAGVAKANETLQLIEAARADFQPVGKPEIQHALTTMRAAQKGVRRFLANRPQYAQGWKNYLNWDEQNRQLASLEALDASFWRVVYLREFRSAAGLDHSAFQMHRAATRRMINVLESAADESLSDHYQSTLDRLATLLDDGSAGVDADQADEVARLLDELDRQQQASGLVKNIREAFAQRNILVHIPERLVDRERTGTIEEDFQVNQRVGGARVRGSGVITAKYEWAPKASKDGAMWRMNIRGDSISRTTAYQNRVSVGSRATIPFHSIGTVRFDLTGFHVSDFTTTGRLRLRTTSIRTPFRGIRHRIARRRALQHQGGSRYRSERNAKRDISASFRREVESRIADANRRYQEEVLLPLKCFDQMPSDAVIRTTDDSIQVGLRLANGRQLSALEGVDNFYTGDQFRLAVHQSALNNAASSLAGKSRSLGRILRRLQGSNLEESEKEQPDVDIAFADFSPLNLSLNDDKVVVRLTGKGFRRGGKKYSAMEIKFCYSLGYEHGEHYLVLEGEPLVQHSLDSNGSRPKVGVRDLSLRRILLSILERDLPQRITLNQLDLPLQRGLLGPLAAVHIEAQNGWVLLEAVRPRDIDPVIAERGEGVVPVSFNAEEPRAVE